MFSQISQFIPCLSSLNSLFISMSGRLASFRGPSTPTSSPVTARQSSTPASPSKSTELPHHRTLRSQLLELRNIAYEWDERVSSQGLKAASSLIDARTELEYVTICSSSGCWSLLADFQATNLRYYLLGNSPLILSSWRSYGLWRAV